MNDYEKKLYICLLLPIFLNSCNIRIVYDPIDCSKKYSDYDYRSSQIDIKACLKHFFDQITLTYYKVNLLDSKYTANDISLDYLNEILGLMESINYSYIDDRKVPDLDYYFEMTCQDRFSVVDIDFDVSEVYLLTKQGEYPCGVDTYYKHYKVDEAELKPLLDDLEWIIKQDSID